MAIDEIRSSNLATMTREQRVDYWLAGLQAERDDEEDAKFLDIMFGWLEQHEESTCEIRDAILAFGFDPHTGDPLNQG